MKRLFLFVPLLFSAAFAADLKESETATIMVGPLVDSADASAETGLTISQADVRLSKNAGNMAQKNEATSCTHDELGIYACQIDATDTNTVGVLTVTVGEAGTLVWSRDYAVLDSAYYDMKYGATSLLTSTMAGLIVNTTVATVTSQTELILTAGPSNDDALTAGSTVLIVGGTEKCEATVADYVGTTTTLHIRTACPALTVATSDEVYAYVGSSGPAIQTAQDDLDTITGEAGVVLNDDAVNVDSVAASAVTEIQTDLATAAAQATAQAGQNILLRGLTQVDTTIATLASQVSFTLTAGSSDDNAYNRCGIMVTDQSTAEQIALSEVQRYTGSTKTVALLFDPGIFTMATGDLVTITCLRR